MTYSEKLKDPRWQKKRLEILERDDFSCQNCEGKSKTLNVHHWKYGKNPWDVENEFMTTVCEDCHKVIGEMKQKLDYRVIFLLTTKKIDGPIIKRLQKLTEWMEVLGLYNGPNGINSEHVHRLIRQCCDILEFKGFVEGSQ